MSQYTYVTREAVINSKQIGLTSLRFTCKPAICNSPSPPVLTEALYAFFTWRESSLRVRAFKRRVIYYVAISVSPIVIFINLEQMQRSRTMTYFCSPSQYANRRWWNMSFKKYTRNTRINPKEQQISHGLFLATIDKRIFDDAFCKKLQIFTKCLKLDFFCELTS